MKIIKLDLQNFRGIKQASFDFADRTLLVGDNNTGKTTLLEAIDLVLGPERVRGIDDINEHDFYGTQYTSDAAEQKISDSNETEHNPEIAKSNPEIVIIVTLCDLTEKEMSRFSGHLELWDPDSREVIRTPNSEQVSSPAHQQFVLRVGFRGRYNSEEDEFEAVTYFLWPEPENSEEYSEYDKFGRQHKRAVGFLYLRSLRTASRAASLQRNSLLDILLRLRGTRPKIWEKLLEDLSTIGAGLGGDDDFQAVIDDLQSRIGRFIPRKDGASFQSQLHVGRLTRESLRNQIAYFLETGIENHSIPYDLFGTGTANVLVVALLSAIADEKQNVIFGMEEPEIALPPHAQRRVVGELFKLSNQSIITSHSPYVAERFLDEEILVIKKDLDQVSSAQLSAQTAVKPKNLRQDFRIKYAEGLLSKGVLVVEGITELLALPVIDSKLSAVGEGAYLSLDLSGVVLVKAGGAGIKDATFFFGELGIPAFPMYDKDKGSNYDDVFARIAGKPFGHGYKGLETLVAEESPLDDLRKHISEVGNLGKFNLSIPDDYNDEAKWRSLAAKIWSKRKGGEGVIADFLQSLPLAKQPRTLVRILVEIFVQVSGTPFAPSDPLAIALPKIITDDLMNLTDDNEKTL